MKLVCRYWLRNRCITMQLLALKKKIALCWLFFHFFIKKATILLQGVGKHKRTSWGGRMVCTKGRVGYRVCASISDQSVHSRACILPHPNHTSILKNPCVHRYYISFLWYILIICDINPIKITLIIRKLNLNQNQLLSLREGRECLVPSSPNTYNGGLIL